MRRVTASSAVAILLGLVAIAGAVGGGVGGLVLLGLVVVWWRRAAH
jgi:hypothetical protein